MVTCIVAVALTLAASPTEEDYYRIVTRPIPEGLKLEVSGMALLPDDRLAVALRKGEVYVINDSGDGSLTAAEYRRFATGLHEPLGLAYRDGALYTAQRTELTRLRDLDADGVADEYGCVAKGWGVTGNYHEYVYGPKIDHDGNFWLTLNASIGRPLNADTAWRGWSIRVRPDGAWNPVSGGMRSPCGIGIHSTGTAFFTDQQGDWMPTNGLHHLREGVFHGYPEALRDCSRPGATFQVTEKIEQGLSFPVAVRRIDALRPPAVWFPYRKMGMSATDVVLDTTGGKFGPFAGQLFVGEFTMSQVNRVFLERVDGEYQGACFPFRRGFQCGVLRLCFDSKGTLHVGETNRGWNSLGSRSYGLEKLVWTGKTPFEIQAMEARPDGFLLTFTLPMDRQTAERVDAYALESYTYRYHQTYGSPEIDRRVLSVRGARVGDDGRSVRLTVEGLRDGYVHELRLSGVRARSGNELLHPVGFYTLNRIPSE